MNLEQYIDNINRRYKLGNATEHTFRGDLQQLIESLIPEIRATNEPKRITCGAPDYILTKKDIEIGYIEAKDIGDKDLSGVKKTGNKEQFDRYKSALPNLIFTDYLDFHLYIEGVFITKIAIAEIQNGTIVALPNNFTTFTNLLKDFCLFVGQTIKSSKKLAEMMAGKARLLSDVIELALTNDENNSEDSTLKDQMNAFKEILIHDITPKGFADVYAQTIAYGMFAARLHDPTLPTFSRQEASELIPKSNPFLRKLFGYIAGPDIDDRIKWIVDSLVEIFLACNVAEILKNYGKSTKMEDPIIHFYETFLSEYDPKLRKAKGVWYTPKPVVNFIVRAVDDILKTEFDLPQGLADNSKIKIKVNLQATDKRYKDNIRTVEEEVHKVQILDPATGTGTFLAEVVKHVHKKFKGQQGVWSNYVETHLLPRLNGFELLMASYAMAHLQMDLLLTETGFKPSKDQRFKIYLTNSLEESHPDTGTLFANWLSSEANEANFIKRDTPVMCIVGNPPYSGESNNKGKWIMKLMEDYKKEPGGKEKLKERNPKAINDDYVKFLRYGQHYIEKNGSGVLAFINPHGFLDNVTYRGMRWNLLKTYDKIYTIDLHGNTKKNETAPDGTADVNVFDIMQGVAITLFVKTGKKKPSDLGKVFHYDLYGKRNFKYDFLSDNALKNIAFTELPNVAPNYFFVNKNFEAQKDYDEGFKIDDLFQSYGMGITTGNDKELVDFNRNVLQNRFPINNIKKVAYRLFDIRYVNYDLKLIDRGREKLMLNFIDLDNLGLISLKGVRNDLTSKFGITKLIIDKSIASTLDNGFVFPLYIYPKKNGQLSTEQTVERIPNFNAEIINKIANDLSLLFSPQKGNEKIHTVETNQFSPIDIFDYIYAVLHSPTYREKYKEFLKIDFPKIPYPKHIKTFWELVDLGSKIRQIHLLESPKVEDYITEFNIDGDCVVIKPSFKDGKIFINETQYFENVPEVAWDFYIGGYQPAQKWLKDRKDRKLEFDDIAHYQKIIVALSETDRIMNEIDKIEIE
ncbi:type ISP restriction/modification enzyme [Flavobacterium psychrophilum]|uniref:type ISP restriction/modification enzyme n=1 Tax=Flavobacterium psychrophilum TaxID=96345 RepID=UPI00290D0ABC|nr:N-6 DNA methylase [Flavobacterium psychrophilum]ELM3649251.1 N-6 DNA methylase [Flavobacterium psychrophilum]ELM3670097.1 N-6 DNA methylase [Flavobacterium psychrophilum]ELM3724811.1 N-6 DNA methylase [Flavobacterium psychrophilum]MEB3383901.1 type ISP restriction/modification enzyme [Flavobacterium psychrophilum]